jgi:hypothetical protein
MRSAFLVAKILLLVVAAAAAVVGFGFFRVWQTNQAPQVTDISWQQESVSLSRAALLQLEIVSPWHRDITRAKPLRLPESLVANAVTLPSMQRGALDWSGHRKWRLSIPMVATAPGTLSGESIELPLSSTRRKSPRTVLASLPDLEVTLPEEIPSDPLNPLELLTAVPPPAAVPAQLGEQVRGPIWPLILATLIVVAGTVLLIQWLRRPKPVIPAWQVAHSSLDQLQGETSLRPERFFSRLTDILKHYTAARFHDNATAASSTEFIASLKSLGDLKDPHPANLTSLVRQADAVKFAEAKPGTDASGTALEAVRIFVNDTTPTPEPENA